MKSIINNFWKDGLLKLCWCPIKQIHKNHNQQFQESWFASNFISLLCWKKLVCQSDLGWCLVTGVWANTYFKVISIQGLYSFFVHILTTYGKSYMKSKDKIKIPLTTVIKIYLNVCFTPNNQFAYPLNNRHWSKVTAT